MLVSVCFAHTGHIQASGPTAFCALCWRHRPGLFGSAHACTMRWRVRGPGSGFSLSVLEVPGTCVRVRPTRTQLGGEPQIPRTDPRREPRPRLRGPNAPGSWPSLPRAGQRVQAVLPAPPPTCCGHTSPGAQVPGGREEERTPGIHRAPRGLGSSAREKGRPASGRRGRRMSCRRCAATAPAGRGRDRAGRTALLPAPRAPPGPSRPQTRRRQLLLPSVPPRAPFASRGCRGQEEAPGSRGAVFPAPAPRPHPGPAGGRAALRLLQATPQVLLNFHGCPHDNGWTSFPVIDGDLHLCSVFVAPAHYSHWI